MSSVESESASPSGQPVVFFGGVFSYPAVYRRTREDLARVTGRRVWLVQAHSYDWLSSLVLAGWVHLLDKLEHAVRQAVVESPTGKVTLIGHSAGGVVSRLFLSPDPFHGHVYRGLDYVDHFITLGSPHHSTHGAIRRRWVSQRYPGAYFSPEVRYISVAGAAVRGDAHGSLRQRMAYRAYYHGCSDGDAWGDGLVPVPCALLDGSAQITLEGVSHFTGFGGPWYGDPDVIPRWWNAESSET